MIAEELKLVIKTEAEKAVRDLKKYQDNATKAKGSTSDLQRKFASFAKGMLTAGGIILAFRMATKAVKDMVDAYGIQETAETKLRAAIKATGKEASISVDALYNYASELQGMTTYGDEATISAMAMLQQLGNLNEKGLKKTIPLVQDFAAAMGVDLETAASLVGKTLGSSTNALSRYGLEVDMTGTKEDKLNNLTDAMREKFGGMAQELAQTGIGAIESYNNAVGDLKEVYGETISKGMEPFVRGLTKIITDMARAKREAIETKAAYDALKSLGEGEKLASEDQLKILKDQVSILGQIAASYEGLDEKANAAYEAAKLKFQQYEDALAKEVYWNEQAARFAEEGKTAAAEAAKIKAANAATLIAWQDKVNAKYGETEEAKKANLDQEIAWYEYWLPRSEIYKEHIRTILELLYEQKEAYNEQKEAVKTLNIALEEQMSISEALSVAAAEAYQIEIEAAEKAKKATEELLEKKKEQVAFITGPFVDAYSDAFGKFGEILIQGGNAWNVFREAFKESIAGLLDAIGKKLVIMALEALIPLPVLFNPAGAALAAAGAAASFTAAGAVRSLAQGGDFIVPPGYPNDSYPMKVESGERVTVTPAAQMQGGQMIHVTFNLGGRTFYDEISKASENGELIIAPRSVRR